MKNHQASRSGPTRDGTASKAPAIANDVALTLRTGDWTNSPTRQLAQRLNGSDEVLLLWHPDSDRVELCVRDLATDASFHLEVAPGDAIDAFHHPYAYMFKRSNRHSRVGAVIPARE